MNYNINNMKHKIISVLLVAFIIVLCNQLSAQIGYSSQIDNARAEMRNDTIIISFDINTVLPIETAWVEIRTTDGKLIANNSLDGKVWDKVASGTNRKIVWAYLNDGVDLSDKDIVITVKANLLVSTGMNGQDNPFGSATNIVPIQNSFQKIEKERHEKVRPTAKYPLLRPGIELGANIDNASSSKATLTMEYIARPWWSIHSGIGYEIADVYSDTSLGYGYKTGTYGSIILPFTAELKLNTGRWFRLYGGGGIMNRFVIKEEDPILNFDQGLKRYVLGAKADAGIEIRSVRIGVSYIKDISSYSVFNEKMNVFNVVLGWRFGGSRAYIRN
jgi:hypothetical protein